MSFLTKHKNALNPRITGAISIFLVQLTLISLQAQMNNGVFDPSKVLVAKEKASQLQVIEQNVAEAKEFNRTLGTPSHPRAFASVVEEPPIEVQVGPPTGPAPVRPPESPTFDVPRNTRQQSSNRPRERPEVIAHKLQEPEAIANKLPTPVVSANPISINEAATDDPQQSIPDDQIDVNGGLEELNNVDVASDSVDLPIHDSAPEGRRRGLLGFFNRSDRKTLDVPERPIPISAGSNPGNPYNDDNFQAGPDYAPLFDGAADREGPNETPGMLSFGAGIAQRTPSKPADDLSQYLVIREETRFEPFQPGTNEIELVNGFELYPGTAVKDLGSRGKTRIVQIDSGEKGLISKSSVRPLSEEEESFMSEGLARGKLWYSILDTAADFDESMARHSADTNRPNPEKPVGDNPKLSSGKPDSDLIQYFVVNQNKVNFTPFSSASGQIDKSTSYDLPKGSVVKLIDSPNGKHHVVETDSGDKGVILVSGIRPLSGAEQKQMKQGLELGNHWYSILDTGAERAVAAVRLAPEPAPSTSSHSGIPKVIKAKPESDLSQYSVVRTDTLMFEPFAYGTHQVDPDTAFEMYRGTVVKVLANADEKRVAETNSGERGLLSAEGLRPLSDTEKQQMASGISNGATWYSILDSAPE